MTRSRSELEPNDWVRYVDATTGETIHIDLFHNMFRNVRREDAPPFGGWTIDSN